MEIKLAVRLFLIIRGRIVIRFLVIIRDRIVIRLLIGIRLLIKSWNLIIIQLLIVTRLLIIIRLVIVIRLLIIIRDWIVIQLHIIIRHRSFDPGNEGHVLWASVYFLLRVVIKFNTNCSKLFNQNYTNCYKNLWRLHRIRHRTGRKHKRRRKT